MSGYSTIVVEHSPGHTRGLPLWTGVASCVAGLVAGLAVVSLSRETSLLTVPVTRTAQTTPTYVQPTRRISVAPELRSEALRAAAVEDNVIYSSELNSTEVLRPLLLLTSVAAFGLSVFKMIAVQAEPSARAMASATSTKRVWGAASGKKYKGVQPIIAPSLLAADLANLAADAKRVMEAGADVLHVDVMDGHFVPNLSWGAPVIKCLRKHNDAFFDTHLMVSNPEDFIAPMADAGVDQFTFHIEAAKDPAALIKAIKDAGMKVGISVKPKTPIDTVFPYVQDVDLILVMTVEPGFGGQSFMEDMMPKVKTLREKYPNLDIQVDGGLGPATIDAATKAGANAIVAGSSCFVADPKAPIDIMRASLEKNLTGPGE